MTVLLAAEDLHLLADDKIEMPAVRADRRYLFEHVIEGERTAPREERAGAVERCKVAGRLSLCRCSVDLDAGARAR